MQHLQDFERRSFNYWGKVIVIGLLLGIFVGLIGVVCFNLFVHSRSLKQEKHQVSALIHSDWESKTTSSVTASTSTQSSSSAGVENSSSASNASSTPTNNQTTDNSCQVAIDEANAVAEKTAQSLAQSAEEAGNEVHVSTVTHP